MKCPACGDEFPSRLFWQKYCSPRCGEREKKRRRRGGAQSFRRFLRKSDGVEFRGGPMRVDCGPCGSRSFVLDGKLNCCGRPIEKA